MVRLHLKKGNDSLFLHDTTVKQNVAELVSEVLDIYDLRLKVLRLCEGMILLINLSNEISVKCSSIRFCLSVLFYFLKSNTNISTVQKCSL